MRTVRPLVLLSLLWWQGAQAQETQVVVMTSYPQALINRYESAFEAAYPDIDLILEWRRSEDARLLLASGQAPVDVYWAPSLDTFVALADADYFATLPLPFAGVPGRIGQLRLDDAQARFAAFEVAGFGVAYSSDWLTAQGLSPPADWGTLLGADYAPALLLPVPSQQGFSPMIYQSIVASQGWETGWALITELAARGSLMTTEGGAFIDELTAGRHGLALSIDFFPTSARLNGEAVGFQYAATTLLSPAYVAQLAQAPHPEAARQFIEYLLSDAGQSLLLAPDIARLPVRPSAYPERADFNPFAGAVTVPAFNLNQAGARLDLLSVLFDVQITARYERLQTLLTAIDSALVQAGAAAAPQLRQARQILLSPVLDTAGAEQLVAQLHTGELTLEQLPLSQWHGSIEQREREVERLITAASAH